MNLALKFSVLVFTAAFAMIAMMRVVDSAAPAEGQECKDDKSVKYAVAKDINMVFCWIPEGSSQLGSSEVERKALLKEYDIAVDSPNMIAASQRARGKFKTKGFWMGKFVVTQEEWAAVGVQNGTESYFSKKGEYKSKLESIDTSRFPIETVSWNECQLFVKALNERGDSKKSFGENVQFKLPHEDEWEYAARGDSASGSFYYWGNSLNGTQANCNGGFPFGTSTKGPYVQLPSTVGSYEKHAPHPWGLCDMSGNVSQWCDNEYSKDDPKKVTRGGSWCSAAYSCTLSRRHSAKADARDFDLGFRIVAIPEKSK